MNKLSDERYEEIKHNVLDLYQECNICTLPIDPVYICQQLRYRLIPYSTLGITDYLTAVDRSEDGYCDIVQTDDGMYSYVIYFNDALDIPTVRKRWTLFHEIGHCYLGHPESNLPYDITEAEANFFAKYAIAPPPLINVLKCRCPEDIMNNFQLSYTAACYNFTYYQKWLQYGPSEYQSYEIDILKQFNVAVA